MIEATDQDAEFNPKGSVVALVTPMATNGDIDWHALEGLLEWHLEQGTAAIGAVGTTGESATLTVPEHCEMIEFCESEILQHLPPHSYHPCAWHEQA